MRLESFNYAPSPEIVLMICRNLYERKKESCRRRWVRKTLGKDAVNTAWLAAIPWLYCPAAIAGILMCAVVSPLKACWLTSGY